MEVTEHTPIIMLGNPIETGFRRKAGLGLSGVFMNHEILKERYSSYRMKIKKLPNGSLEKRELKQELSLFLKEVDEIFGKEVVLLLVKKKI